MTDGKLTPNMVGERSQGAIVAEVVKYGYTVLVPFGEAAHRYDLVIEKGGQFLRLQCKTGAISMERSILVVVALTGITRRESDILVRR